MTTFAENLRGMAETANRARLVARSFYREMRRAGFADRDIVTAADELLGCLAATLRLQRIRKEAPVPDRGDP